MGIKIVPYCSNHEPAVDAFNERLRGAGVEFQFFSRASSEWLPADEGLPVHRIYRLAIDDEEVVRGGYALRRQQFWINGTRQWVGNYQLPLSEGIYDAKFRTLGMRLLRSALRESPLLYSLGMGGITQPLPKLLGASGFALALVPFFFRVLNAGRFLREMQLLQTPSWRRWGARISARTGVGAGGIHLAHRLRDRSHRNSRYRVEIVPEFGDWIDEVWESVGKEGLLVGDRRMEAMRQVFPASREANLKVRLEYSGRPVGFVVLRCTPLSGDHYFGNLRLGSIVDGWASKEHIVQLVRLATDLLKEQSADLIISNQSLASWQFGLQRCGYLSFRSNFGLGVSPKLSALLPGGLPANLEACHFNRADGDGPIHI